MRGVPLARNVDAYLRAAPDTARPKLVQLRNIVRSVAPDAEETISYGMPYYKWHGALVGYAVFKNHIGLFPGAIVKDFTADLEGYETGQRHRALSARQAAAGHPDQKADQGRDEAERGENESQREVTFRLFERRLFEF